MESHFPFLGCKVDSVTCLNNWWSEMMFWNLPVQVIWCLETSALNLLEHLLMGAPSGTQEPYSQKPMPHVEAMCSFSSGELSRTPSSQRPASVVGQLSFQMTPELTAIWQKAHLKSQEITTKWAKLVQRAMEDNGTLLF